MHAATVMELEHCPHCTNDVEPEPPAWRWKALTAAFWIALMFIVPATAAIVGINVVLFPVLLGVSLAIGTAARLATTWTCPECRSELHRPENLRDAYKAHRLRMKARRERERAASLAAMHPHRA